MQNFDQWHDDAVCVGIHKTEINRYGRWSYADEWQDNFIQNSKLYVICWFDVDSTKKLVTWTDSFKTLYNVL